MLHVEIYPSRDQTHDACSKVSTVCYMWKSTLHEIRPLFKVSIVCYMWKSTPQEIRPVMRFQSQYDLLHLEICLSRDQTRDL